MQRRIGYWLVVATVALCTGGCPDFLQGDPQDNVGGDPRPRETLAVSVSAPGADASVGTTSTVPIIWSATNTTGNAGQATVVVEALATLTQTTIADGIAVGRSSGRVTTNWTTAGFTRGTYRVRVRVTAGDLTRESTAPGVVTLNEAATFSFLAPLTDVERTQIYSENARTTYGI